MKKEYQAYISNIEWHIRVNKPTGDELHKCNIQLDAYREILKDLLATPLQDESQSKLAELHQSGEGDLNMKKGEDPYREICDKLINPLDALSFDVEHPLIDKMKIILHEFRSKVELYKASGESKQVTDSLSESDIAEQYKETAQKLIVKYINFDDPNGYFKASVQHYYEKGSATGSFNIKLSEMIYRAIHLDRIERGESKQEGDLTIEDYKEVIESHKSLVRELDVLINGKNAAKQASLCDIVSQLKSHQGESKVPVQRFGKEDVNEAIRLSRCIKFNEKNTIKFLYTKDEIFSSLPSVNRESLPVDVREVLNVMLENEVLENKRVSDLFNKERTANNIHAISKVMDLYNFYLEKQSLPIQQPEEGWIRVEDELPENCKCVLGTDGRTQSVVNYTKGHEIAIENDEDDDYDEYEEKNGTKYLKPGWYELEETPGCAYDETWVEKKVTHWQPLPSPPKQDNNAQ